MLRPITSRQIDGAKSRASIGLNSRSSRLGYVLCKPEAPYRLTVAGYYTETPEIWQ